MNKNQNGQYTYVFYSGFCAKTLRARNLARNNQIHICLVFGDENLPTIQDKNLSERFFYEMEFHKIGPWSAIRTS
jgi:hypothetical protein